MKYPNFGGIDSVSKEGDINATNVVLKTVISSIDYIYDKENVYYAKDASEEELTDFVESLNREQFAMIQTFFESIPRLKKEIKFKCQKCGYEEEILLEGIQSFFV